MGENNPVCTTKTEDNFALTNLDFNKKIGCFLIIVQFYLLCLFTIIWIRCCCSSIGPDPVLISKTFLVSKPSSFLVHVCSNLKRKSMLSFQASKNSIAKDFDQSDYDEFLTAMWRNKSRLILPQSSLDSSSKLFQPDNFVDVDLGTEEFVQFFLPFMMGAYDEEDLILGFSCNDCNLDFLHRCDVIVEGKICHKMIQTSPSPFKTAMNLSFIYNTENYDHLLEGEDAEVTLKLPFVGDVTVQRGTTTKVHLAFEEQTESGNFGLTKAIQTEQGLQGDYLGLFTSMKAGQYLQKSCYALPSRAKVLEHTYPGLCSLLQGTIQFQPDGQVRVLNLSRLVELNHLIEKFASENLAFVTITTQGGKGFLPLAKSFT